MLFSFQKYFQVFGITTSLNKAYLEIWTLAKEAALLPLGQNINGVHS